MGELQEGGRGYLRSPGFCARPCLKWRRDIEKTRGDGVVDGYIYIYIRRHIRTHTLAFIRVYGKKKELTADFNRLHVTRRHHFLSSFADPSPPTRPTRNALLDDERLYGLPRTVQV